MVKHLHTDEKAAVATAIGEAESRTAADIVLVVTPASDSYARYVFLDGFVLGSLIAVGLWAFGIVTEFPYLLAVQLLMVVLLTAVPPARRLCARLAPRHVLHHRAAIRASAEYLAVTRHVPPAAPVVLIYVSLLERYVHVLPNSVVREKIPDEAWKTVVEKLTASTRTGKLQEGCILAAYAAGDILAPQFPNTGAAHVIRKPVIMGRA